MPRATHIDYNKGLKWEVLSGAAANIHEPLVYRTTRKDGERILSFATVTTRVGGERCIFKAEITILNSNGKTATSLERIFEGRGCQYSARKWAEIMLFYPPARVITHVEL